MSKRTDAAERRYQLHKAVKKFARVQAWQKKIFIDSIHEITDRQQAKLTELISVFGYSVQYQVPGTKLHIKQRISMRLQIKWDPAGPIITAKEKGKPAASKQVVAMTRKEAKKLRDLLITEYA